MLEDKAYLQIENAYVTNPNLGASVDIPFLERELKKAQENGAESLLGTMAKHWNVEVGLAMQSDRWPGADYWEQCAVSRFELEELIERSDVIDIGIDGGGLDSLILRKILHFWGCVNRRHGRSLAHHAHRLHVQLNSVRIHPLIIRRI